MIFRARRPGPALQRGPSLGSLEPGSIIQLNVNGTPRNFIVIHQGLPSSIYDASCDGVWVLMEDIYETRQWHNSNLNPYAGSDIHAYLNSTFLALFDSAIQSAIIQAKIPYGAGNSTSTVYSGSNGLSTKVFLLSGYEVGWTTTTNQYFPVDGACLSYFSGTAATDAKRIGYLNGTAAYWWLRSPRTNDSSRAWVVLPNGSYSYNLCSNSWGVRPALILPSSLIL